MASDPPLNFDPTPFLEKFNEPWIKYNLNRIMGKNKESEFKKLAKDPSVQRLVDACVMWPDPPLTKHNDAYHPIHIMEVLVDFGLNTEDEWINALSKLILNNLSAEGLFQSKIEIPERWGGRGVGELTWLLCDTPILIYVLKKFGVVNEQTEEAERLLVWMSENNGWRCKGENPNWRGPGKKEDHCPYANLIALKVLSKSKYKETKAVQNAIDSQILHWANRNESKIRMFGIGTTFKKLKYPNVWYDILHVVDVLSQYPYSLKYEEFWEMWNIIRDKQDPGGGFVPESVWKAWNSWSFGQKKEPCPWITLKILEIAERVK